MQKVIYCHSFLFNHFEVSQSIYDGFFFFGCTLRNNLFLLFPLNQSFIPSCVTPLTRLSRKSGAPDFRKRTKTDGSIKHDRIRRIVRCQLHLSHVEITIHHGFHECRADDFPLFFRKD